jgi:hypothetical protein
MTHCIRDWYGRQPLWVQITNALLLLLFSLGLPVTLMKSGFEFKAIAWHFRHGNSIAVNGVKFPVYFWYAPDNSRDRYHVFDQPGPLRPTNDTFTMFTIDGRRDPANMGTPQELAQRAMLNYGVKGFEERSTFEWKTHSQTLECMQERDARVSLSIIFCYGDGPIYSVSFNGDDNALERLNRIIAEAR